MIRCSVTEIQSRANEAEVYYDKFVLSRFDGAGYNFRRGVADRRRRASSRRVASHSTRFGQ